MHAALAWPGLPGAHSNTEQQQQGTRTYTKNTNTTTKKKQQPSQQGRQRTLRIDSILPLAASPACLPAFLSLSRSALKTFGSLHNTINTASSTGTAGKGGEGGKRGKQKEREGKQSKAKQRKGKEREKEKETKRRREGEGSGGSSRFGSTLWRADREAVGGGGLSVGGGKELGAELSATLVLVFGFGFVCFYLLGLGPMMHRGVWPPGCCLQAASLQRGIGGYHYRKLGGRRRENQSVWKQG